MGKNRTFISFDWAMKRLLRNKANFVVLEGFLTTLLGTEIKIDKIIESEGNQDRQMEGRAEGLEEGRRSEKVATAKKMKDMNMDPQSISSITGLTIDEIIKL